MLVERRHTMDAAAFDRYLEQQARSRREARAIVRRVEEHAAAEARENTATWDAMEASLPAAAQRHYLRVAVPSGPRHLVRLSKHRRAVYEAHMRGLIDEALSAAPAAAAATHAPVPDPVAVQGESDAALPAPVSTSTPESTASAAVAARLCGLCGGGCCVRGGDTAYLTVATLRRVIESQPQLDAAQLLSAYMSRLPTRTEAGSCINHTAGGCGLPRELRSGTCNDYACGALRTVTAPADDEPPPTGVLVIRRQLDRWAKAGLHGPNGITALALISGTDGRQPARTMILGTAMKPAAETGPGTAQAGSGSL